MALLMAHPSFAGLRVLAFEARRATELATLIRTYGGEPLSAPALREVPIESNTEAFAFVERLVAGEYDVVIFLTGVGLRALLTVVDASVGREPFVAALQGTRVAARGPKPLAVLRELGVTPWLVAPEPNTWRELLAALDAAGPDVLRGARVGLQEYGTSPGRLLEGLAERGATITRVPVYRYGLPDDLTPLQQAVRAIADGGVDVALFTTATHVPHLLHVAGDLGLEERVREGLARAIIASIGPTTSEELRDQGLDVDLEPSHPKMGVLVREAAERAPGLLLRKRVSR